MKETLSHVSAAPFIRSYPSFAQFYQSYASDPELKTLTWVRFFTSISQDELGVLM